MVVKFVGKNGLKLIGHPYTAAEKREADEDERNMLPVGMFVTSRPADPKRHKGQRKPKRDE